MEYVRLEDLFVDDPLVLPDELLGERFIVGVGAHLLGAGSVWVISGRELPRLAVVWGFGFSLYVSASPTTMDWRVGLGFAAPTSAAEMSELRKLPLWYDHSPASAGTVEHRFTSAPVFIPARHLLSTQGERLVGELKTAVNHVDWHFWLVVSAVPAVVPKARALGLGLL